MLSIESPPCSEYDTDESYWGGREERGVSVTWYNSVNAMWYSWMLVPQNMIITYLLTRVNRALNSLCKEINERGRILSKWCHVDRLKIRCYLDMTWQKSGWFPLVHIHMCHSHILKTLPETWDWLDERTAVKRQVKWWWVQTTTYRNVKKVAG